MCPKNKSFLLLFIHYISEINGTVMAWRDWGKNVCFCNTETELKYFFKNLQTRHKKHFDRQIFILKWAN